MRIEDTHRVTQLARSTSEPFSSVLITSTVFGPPGDGFASGMRVVEARKWPR